MALSELLPTLHKLSASEKLKLIRILAEDLDFGEDISTLKSAADYTQPELLHEESLERLLRYAGAISDANPSGIGNKEIDVDLARAYLNNF